MLSNDFQTQRDAIDAGKVDLIYANPYDTSMLVREKGFTALVKPKDEADEATVAVHSRSPAKTVEDLEAGVKVALTLNIPVFFLLLPALCDE
ncbi:PhnD/SsuA/transferrin family substrate-binding protein [Nitrosococcus watsonii]|uniref:PhnD/SsuA/transferrin family substrate-binding protein n=1 Tax=Nitrosococcus watsonii TaxID=473531 RepID=UPI0022B65DC5|nr:PhnD/SsuA/transferrin family substrate-binding protein [Nitrosococcus watsonii]